MRLWQRRWVVGVARANQVVGMQRVRVVGGVRLMGVGSGNGEKASGMEVALYSVLREEMSLAMGPFTAHVLAWFTPGRNETRPWVGLRP